MYTVYIAIVLLSTPFIIGVPALTCSPDFTCDAKHPTKVTLDDTKDVLYCNKGMTCNTHKKSCDLCVNGGCGGYFECVQSSNVIVVINKNQFMRCEENKVCNRNPTLTTACIPCVPEKCEAGDLKIPFVCTDENKWQMPGTAEGTCMIGYVCNKNNVKPCLPCVKAENALKTVSQLLLH